MAEPKKFTAEEVALHSSKKDCWLTIHGKVYDITNFLEDHPGGEDVVLYASAQGDATQSFEDVGHSSTARSMMTSYEIGVLDGFDPSKDPQAGKRGGGNPRASTSQPNLASSFMDVILPLLILGVALTSWYYLTYYNSEKP